MGPCCYRVEAGRIYLAWDSKCGDGGGGARVVCILVCEARGGQGEWVGREWKGKGKVR